MVSTAHRRTELARRSQKANRWMHKCTNVHVSSYAVSVCGGDGNNFDWDLVMALLSLYDGRKYFCSVCCGTELSTHYSRVSMCVVAIVVPHGDIHPQCHRFSLGLRLHLKHSRHSIARISSISRLNLLNKSAFCQKSGVNRLGGTF